MRKQCGKPEMCFLVGEFPQDLPVSFLQWTETKGLQFSLRYFIWLVSNKYHNPSSKFLHKTIYGHFTAWRTNTKILLNYRDEEIMFFFQRDHRKKINNRGSLHCTAFTCKLLQGRESKSNISTALGDLLQDQSGQQGLAGPEPAQEHHASQNLLLPRLASITSVPLCLLWLVFILETLLGEDLLLPRAKALS